jgi:dienelactone hydrolase
MQYFIKRLLLLFFCLSLFDLVAQSKAQAPRYIFFLHNLFVELQGLEGRHPEYGRVEYKEIVQAFEKQGFTVISEVRPKNTEVKTYAKKVAGQIDSLLKKGVPAGHITVVGTSKGGFIAMQVSDLVKSSDLNFVFIGCCTSDSDQELNVKGNILSIYEKGDTRSCAFIRERVAKTVNRFQEIELHTGLRHGFLYKALNEWIEPSAKWARQEF